jgi:hypothetical protein
MINDRIHPSIPFPIRRVSAVGANHAPGGILESARSACRSDALARLRSQRLAAPRFRSRASASLRQALRRWCNEFSRSMVRTLPAVGMLVLALAAAGALTGCRLTHGSGVPASAAAPAAFTPDGRWRSQRGFVMSAHLRPDGTLEMIDARHRSHLFQRVAPDRWEARISREVKGSIHPEGDQLVFRTMPLPEARKPIAQKNGLMIVHSAKPIEDRMTRVPETAAKH